MRIICFLSTYYGPSGRFRFLQYEKEFAKKNYQMTYSAIYPMRHFTPKFSSRFINKIVSRCVEPLRMLHVLLSGFRLLFYDAVFLNKDISSSSRIQWYESYFLFFNKNIYFDLDDAIFFANKGERDKKFQTIFPKLKGIIVSNKYLKEYAEKLNPNSKVIPMGIDMEFYTEKVFDVSRKEMIIGWSGSDRSYETTFPSVIPALEKLAKQQNIKVLIIKNTDPELKIPNVDVEFIPWSKETEVESVKKMDIGLMPLIEDEFQRYKSALKALQYMAVGIPALVSPIGINSTIVEDGVHGFHCVTEQDWIKNIEKFIVDRNLIQQLGKNARLKIEREHALSVLINDYISFIKK
jgi:glycosyltransferase involved in cell wall biosynthesis